MNVQTSLPINSGNTVNATFVVANAGSDSANLTLTPASKQDNINLTKISLQNQTGSASQSDLTLTPIQKETNLNLTPANLQLNLVPSTQTVTD
mgnify:FL=1